MKDLQFELDSIAWSKIDDKPPDWAIEKLCGERAVGWAAMEVSTLSNYRRVGAMLSLGNTS